MRLLLLLSYLAFISLGLPDTVLGVAWPSVRDGFGIAQSALGLVLGAGIIGYFTSGLIAGWLTSRLGVGGLLAGSSGLVGVALAAYALAPSWPLFFPVGALMGLGSGAIDAGLNGYAARHFSVRHINWLHGCWGIGASTGPALMTAVIAQGFGYRAGYAVLAFVLFGMTLAFIATRRAWADPAAVTTPPEAASAQPSTADAAPAPPSPAASFGDALRSRPVWLGMLTFFTYTGVETTTGSWCFTLLREGRGMSVEAAGSLTAAYWASLTVGRLALGFIVDHVGPDRLLRLATVGAVAGAALFAVAPGVLSGAGLMLIGLSLAPIFPTLMARTPGRLGADLARHAVGFQVSVATLGSALVPGVVGLLVTSAGVNIIAAAPLLASCALFAAHELLLRVAPVGDAQR